MAILRVVQAHYQLNALFATKKAIEFCKENYKANAFAYLDFMMMEKAIHALRHNAIIPGFFLLYIIKNAVLIEMGIMEVV